MKFINIRTGRIAVFILCAAIIFGMARFFLNYVHEKSVLKEMISRLTADTRIAEVLVTGVNYDDFSNKIYTTIKFLEYNTAGEPLEPRYFTFTGNIIQFQSLVIRFDDCYVLKDDRLRGKSIALFMKAFMLDRTDTQEYEITKLEEVPEGYKVSKGDNAFEKKIWQRFWKYAIDPKSSNSLGIKNCQIEAPGTIFVPGILYKISIEHDGGMRIDSHPLPDILKGEKIPG
ncbi:MAG: hypothetical protein JW800_00265 [Candidatus Omnitrophica bacterium]|nr:hypothetical protein [Candidatus Omnitrophota bacterium]